MANNIPDIDRKYEDYYREVIKSGVLPSKVRELIAVAVSLAAGCKACYNVHLEKAKALGGTEEEIKEASAISEIVTAGKLKMLLE